MKSSVVKRNGLGILNFNLIKRKAEMVLIVIGGLRVKNDMISIETYLNSIHYCKINNRVHDNLSWASRYQMYGKGWNCWLSYDLPETKKRSFWERLSNWFKG